MQGLIDSNFELAARMRRALSFQTVRSQHSSELAEDYTELISDLGRSSGEARICDIALHLGVSHVTALRAIKRLQRAGYVLASPRKPISLTSKGKKLARYSKRRHTLLVDFLVSLGVPRRTAEVDVEGIEHHISKTTLRFIESHLRLK